MGSWGILECMTTGGFGDNDGAKRDEVRSALVDAVVKGTLDGGHVFWILVCCRLGRRSRGLGEGGVESVNE